MRLPLYSIPPASYLFTTKLAAQGGLNEKEEPVRQWCAFELIRAYGVNITDMTFEEEVKVGSKTYRIDILIRRNGLPWIVVECKQPKHSKHDDGLDQAVSYAGTVNVSAEYAVYTNGTAWQVKRRVGGEWNSVPDLPVSGPTRSLGSIDELLLTIEMVSPLLHKLDEPLSGKDTRLYLEALQEFFHGSHLITSGVDHDLCYVVDHVLRALSTGPANEHYSRTTLSKAASLAEQFRSRTGVGIPLVQLHENESVFMFMTMLSSSMHPMLDAGRPIGGVNYELIQLMIALLGYGSEQARQCYTPFPAYLHTSLRSFLTKAMALSMDIHVPDALEEKFTSNMKSFTRQAWENLAENDNRQQKDTLGAFMKAIGYSLLPWRWFNHRKHRSQP